MKILYAIQGTGNGHMSRALDIVPALRKRATVDVLVSGCQADLSLPFPIAYRSHGLSFIFGKKGGINFVKTFLQLNSKKFYRESTLLPVEEYDLVISDFEPVSAWACHLKNLPCVALSHQSVILSPSAPRPSKDDIIGKTVLKNYAPATDHYGFHFEQYDPGVFTPVIRRQVRELQPTNKGHYTVYLPCYDDETLYNKLSTFKQVTWEVFSKHNKKPFSLKNITINPVNNEAFVQSMTSSAGVLCGAGFETPSEALYLGKKLLVIPMKNQYEQLCNAAALRQMGVPVIKSLKLKNLPVIHDWLAHGEPVAVNYPDETDRILDLILAKHAPTAYLDELEIRN